MRYLFLAGPGGSERPRWPEFWPRPSIVEKGPAPIPCNQCPSCREITQGISLDVQEIDGASNRGIDDIRELRRISNTGRPREVIRSQIVDEVHMLTGEAFNALLKTLEEPPEHAPFIFATTEL